MYGKNIFKYVFILAVWCPLMVTADMQEYIREYTYRLSDADSKITSREISLQKIKAKILNELLDAHGIPLNSLVETTQNGKNKDEFKQKMIALTAGFVRVEIIEERFNGETYYLKAKASADPDDIVQRINKLGQIDKQSQRDKQRLALAYQELKSLKEELDSLKAELAQAKRKEESMNPPYNQFSKCIDQP